MLCDCRRWGSRARRAQRRTRIYEADLKRTRCQRAGCSPRYARMRQVAGQGVARDQSGLRHYNPRRAPCARRHPHDTRCRSNHSFTRCQEHTPPAHDVCARTTRRRECGAAPTLETWPEIAHSRQRDAMQSSSGTTFRWRPSQGCERPGPRLYQSLPQHTPPHVRDARIPPRHRDGGNNTNSRLTVNIHERMRCWSKLANIRRAAVQQQRGHQENIPELLSGVVITDRVLDAERVSVPAPFTSHVRIPSATESRLQCGTCP